MKTLELSEAEGQLSSLVEDVEAEPLALERDGKQIAFLVSPAEFATTLQARRKAALDSLHAIHTEIESRMNKGEYTQQDLDDLVGSLDRKAS